MVAVLKPMQNRARHSKRLIRADRKADGGKLTAAEKQEVNRQQKGLSKQIDADKHNGAVDKFGHREVGKRQENQQDALSSHGR